MRKAHLMNASMVAMAAILANMPQAASAQSYNATGTITTGAGLIDVATPKQTNVFLDSPIAVIDWTTSEPVGSGPINFQPVGTTATYINRDANSITVLNRLLPADPTRPMQFNGTVISRLQNFATGTVTRGGTLFFYSPGGILVGATGVFDVGSLVLTSSDLAIDAATGDFGKSGTYRFLPANPGSSVQVLNGARITAGPLNSYVALVAPKVVNAGTITVDGSAVLVAADASTITFRPNGLFDIQIDQGTSATGEVVTNSGTIEGPAGSINTAHRIYVVAVPKNDAITMAIQGGSKLGFDIAGAADVDGNAIVLSAGYDIAGGEIAATRSAGGSAFPATLTVGAINATSQLTGQATGQASLQVQGGNAANFASNVSISGVTDPAAVNADAAFVSVSGVGSTLDIAGDLLVKSLDAGLVTGSGPSDASAARIVVSDGRMTIVGSATVDASRLGFGGFANQGGEAALVASSGAAVGIGNDLVLSGDGIGEASADLASTSSGTGNGGSALVSFGGGATVTVGGDLAVHALGTGGEVDLGGFAGGDGIGGSALVEGLAGGGTITVSGALTLDASGTGADGFNCTACLIEGGTGIGGRAGISAAPGAQVTITGAATVKGSGQGGFATLAGGKAGGAGTGGQVFVQSTGGAINAAGGLSIFADGTGGGGAFTNTPASGAPGVGAVGGAGGGGTATLSAGDLLGIGRGGSVTVTGAALISAGGIGGDGGVGANGTGGAAFVTARNGAISGSDLSVRSLGLGGTAFNGGTGGAGSGGTAQIAGLSALEGDSSVTFGTTAITARGTGGAGSTPTAVAGPGGAGGAGTGGNASAIAEAGNGILNLGVVTINASGGGGAGGIGGVDSSLIGGTGGAGGAGQGGLATLGVVSGLDTGVVNSGSAAFAAATVLANGLGGTGGGGGGSSISGAPGNGGNAQGGGASLIARGGAVTISGAAEFLANALGGGGGGGTGRGGDAAVGGKGSLEKSRGVKLEVGSRDGHADHTGRVGGTSLSFSASAEAGKGGASGTATVQGHPLTYLLDRGAIDADSLDFTAAGTIGTGFPPSVISLTGGNTTLGGAFTFVTPATVTATLDRANLNAASVLISASDWLPGIAPEGPVGTLRGLTSVTLTTGKDLFGHLSVRSGANLALVAGGLVRFDNLTAQADIAVNAGTTIALGDILAIGSVAVAAPGNISVRAVEAFTDVALLSGGALDAFSVLSGQSVRLGGTSSITLGGNVLAGDAVSLVSEGAITGSGVSAGLVSPSAAPAATYDITVFGKGAIKLGSLAAARDIKLFTPQDLTVGALEGREIAVLVSGEENIGSIAGTGRVLLADYAMTSVGGDPLDTYDLGALFSAAPAAASGSITILAASTSGSLTAATKGDLAADAIGAAGGIDLQAGGTLSTGALIAGGAATATSTGTMSLVLVTAGDVLTLSSGGAMKTGGLAGANGVSVAGLGAVTAGAVSSSAGGAALTAADNLTSGAVSANGSVSLTSTSGGVTAGDLASTGGAVILSAFSAGSVGDVTAVSGITADAGGGLSLTSARSSAGDVVLDAGGDLASGSLAAAGGRLLISAGGAAAVGNLDAAGLAGGVGLSVAAGTTLELGNAAAGAGELRLSSGGALTGGDLAARAGTLTVSSGGGLIAGALSGRDGIAVTAGGDTQLIGGVSSSAGNVSLKVAGALTGQAITSDTGSILVEAQTSVAAASISAATGLTVSSEGALVLGALKGSAINAVSGAALTTGAVTATSGTVVLAAAGDLTTAAVSAPGAVSLASTNGNLIASGAILAGTDVVLSAKGNLAAAKITAGGGLDVGGDVVALGDLKAARIAALAGATLSTGALTASGGPVSLQASGDLSSGVISATGAVSLNSGGGAVTVQDISAGGILSLAAATDLRTGTLNAGGEISASGVNVALGNTRGSRITAAAREALDIGSIETTAETAELTAGGALRSGAITSSGTIQLAAGAGLATGDLSADGAVLATSAGDAALGSVRSRSSTVELRSTGGSLTVGAVNAGTNTVLVAANDLGLGAVAARDILLLAGNDVQATSANSPGNRILVGDAALAGRGGAFGAYDFDAVFAAPLQSVGGSITIAGAVSGGAFTAAANGGANLAGIDASRFILIDSGAAVNLSGVVKAPDIEIRASDLTMPAGSGLNAGVAGTVRLVSRNGAGMRIGDGLDDSIVPDSGFKLDNAEWGRINSGSLSVFGIDGAGAVDMLIGKLDVTGPDAGSTIDDPAGTAGFRTGASPSSAASGTIRVTGALAATGFRAGNTLAFAAERFELASDTGSIAVLGIADALSGAVLIEARDIHFAAAPLLAQLAADPFFAGVEAALDVQSAGGSQPVLRAGALDFRVGRTLYIQRSGTGSDPLGFDDPLDGFKVGLAGASPITVIINGTFRTAAGVVGGIDAWKLFKDSGADISGFTADSRLNGCLLNAATCGVVPPLDPAPDADPGIRTLIDLLDEPAPKDAAPEDPESPEPKRTNAILPPQSILAVKPDPLPVQIDEAIAGSGNPALMGAGIGAGGGPLQ